MNTPLKYSRLIVLFFLALIVSACHDDDETPKTGPANRTVLVYMMAENSLSKYAEEGGSLDSDIQEMIQGASSIPDNDHLIVFLDDADASQKPRIYEIKKATKKKEAQAELVREYTEEVCSTDPAVLEEVLNYVKRNYPAKGYGLVMWSHGSGWLPAGQKKDSRSIGVDNENNTSSNTGIEMEISDLAEVIAGFGKLDFLYFDACYMQGIEVAYELRGVTDYVIGCPAETPALGARYDKIIPPMFAPVADIKGIVNNNFNYYLSIYNTNTKNDAENYGCLMSAIKCSELDALAEMTAPIMKLAVFEPAGLTEESVKYWMDRFGKECVVVTSGNEWIDFIPFGTNKAKGIREYQKRYHISPEECIAFGDEYNDIEMLKAVKYGFAMEHSKEGVRAATSYMTKQVEPVLEKLIRAKGRIEEVI